MRVTVHVAPGPSTHMLVAIAKAIRDAYPDMSESEAAERAKSVCIHRGIADVHYDLQRGILPPTVL